MSHLQILRRPNYMAFTIRSDNSGTPFIGVFYAGRFLLVRAALTETAFLEAIVGDEVASAHERLVIEDELANEPAKVLKRIEQHQAKGSGRFYEIIDYPFDPATLPEKDADAFGRLAELFDDEINNQLDDPFIYDEDLEGEPLRVAVGTPESFERFVAAVIATVPADARAAIHAINTHFFEVGIQTAADGSGAEIEALPGLDAVSLELLRSAIDAADPTGHEYEYNDGARDFWSGYSRYGLMISGEIDRDLDAEEARRGLNELAAWLRDAIDPDEAEDLIERRAGQLGLPVPAAKDESDETASDGSPDA